MTKIIVVFYSMTGNTALLAQAVAQGAQEAGATVKICQFPELMPQERFNDRIKRVKEELKDIPLVTNDDIVWADGIAFGTPTRFGNMSSQMKNFIDQMGPLWIKGSLINKVGTLFTSVSSLHGGHESTILASMIPLFHLGMIIIGLPYSEPELSSLEVGGGSPYGASSVSGPKADIKPTKNDLRLAFAQGKRLAMISAKMCKE
jgi:NAD(P)H dehydrogenase (quinone)